MRIQKIKCDLCGIIDENYIVKFKTFFIDHNEKLHIFDVLDCVGDIEKIDICSSCLEEIYKTKEEIWTVTHD